MRGAFPALKYNECMIRAEPLIPSGGHSRLTGIVSVLVLLASQCGGCAALPIATVGSLLGVTASAVSTGADVYRLGKIDSAEMANFAEAAHAVRGAGAELGLAAKRERRKDGAAFFEFADRKGAWLNVRVEPRAARLVYVRVDVGWFGSEAAARLMLERLRAHLPRPEPPGREGPGEPPGDGREAG